MKLPLMPEFTKMPTASSLGRQLADIVLEFSQDPCRVCSLRHSRNTCL